MNTPKPWPDEATAPGLGSRVVTLIAKRDGDLVWAVGKGDKRSLIAHSRGPLWATWMGEWQAHLFTVPRHRAREELGVQ